MNKPSRLSAIGSLGRDYYLVFSAGTLSDIGGFTTHAAMILHVYKITGQNKAFMGLAALAMLVPMLLAAPIAGVWAEKYNRKWVMIGNDIFRAPLVLCLMMTDNVWLLLGIQALGAASTSLFMPSRNSIIPELVGKDKIHLANSINGGVLSVVHILGPVLGAGIYAATGSLMWIVILDASTYVASWLLLSLLHYRPTERKSDAASTMLSDVTNGLLYVRSRPDLRHILMIILFGDMAIGLLLPLLRPFIDEVLDGRDVTYGYLMSAFGLGGVVGPIAGYWLGKRLGLGRTLLTAFMLEGAFMVAWSRASNLYVSLFVIFLWGVNVFILIPCFMSYIHSYAKPEFMGRTFALFDQTAYGAQIVGAIVVMALGESVESQAVLTIAGGLYLTLIVLTAPTAGARLLASRRGEVRRPGDSAEESTGVVSEPIEDGADAG